MHISWGTVLLFDDSPLNITAISTISRTFGSRFVIGPLLILIGVCAAISAWRAKTPNMIDLLLILPQQFILVESSFGAILCIARGSFADGVVRDRAFLFTDQIPMVIAASLHTAALLNFFARNIVRRFTEKYHWLNTLSP